MVRCEKHHLIFYVTRRARDAPIAFALRTAISRGISIGRRKESESVQIMAESFLIRSTDRGSWHGRADGTGGTSRPVQSDSVPACVPSRPRAPPRTSRSNVTRSRSVRPPSPTNTEPYRQSSAFVGFDMAETDPSQGPRIDERGRAFLSYLNPTTIPSGPASRSTVVRRNPTSFIHFRQSAPVKSKPP